MQTGAVWAEFSPPIGSQAIWDTPPGSGQPSNVEAFAMSRGDLLNVLNGAPGLLQWSVPASLNIANKPGTPDGNGGISKTQAGQFGAPAEPDPVLDNPIRILDLAWSSDDPTPRTVAFRFDCEITKIYLDYGLGGWVGDKWFAIDSPDTGFEVVPAPAAWALVLLGLPRQARRRPARRNST
jgi:hypothetical protein